jgi:hypothetical protein
MIPPLLTHTVVTIHRCYASIFPCVQYSHAQVNIILVGNKCDLRDDRGVSTEEGKAYAESCDPPLRFFETSAKQNIGMEVLDPSGDEDLSSVTTDVESVSLLAVSVFLSRSYSRSSLCLLRRFASRRCSSRSPRTSRIGFNHPPHPRLPCSHGSWGSRPAGALPAGAP